MNTRTKDVVFPTADQPDAASESTAEIEREPSEDAIDQGVAESFPASDPVSVNVTKIERAEDGSTVEKGRAGST